jgi:hypothetical protein
VWHREGQCRAGWEGQQEPVLLLLLRADLILYVDVDNFLYMYMTSTKPKNAE